MDWLGRLLSWLEPWLAYWLELMEGGSLLGLGAAVLAGVVGYAAGSKGITRRPAAGRSKKRRAGRLPAGAAVRVSRVPELRADTAGGADRGGGKHKTADGRLGDARTRAGPGADPGGGRHIHRDPAEPEEARSPLRHDQLVARATAALGSSLLRLASVRVPDDLMNSEGGGRISQKEIVEDEKDAQDEPKLGVFGLPFQTLLLREVQRFMSVWTQTLLAPLFTSALYIVVFGYGLGSRIREVEGIPYLEFILPGLILLSVITGSYGNTSSSLFDAKRERYIDDVLISPITPFQMALAYVLGGALRGMIVGAGTFALAIPLAGLPAERPLLLLASGLATSVIFASLGVVAGVLATRIDHIFFLSTIVIQPLTFLLLLEHHSNPAFDLPGRGLLLDRDVARPFTCGHLRGPYLLRRRRLPIRSCGCLRRPTLSGLSSVSGVRSDRFPRCN